MAEGSPFLDPEVESVVVNVTVEQSIDFRSYHANGAMGGINQLGEMYIAFFAERGGRTNKASMRVFRDGRSEIVPETREKEPGITRELQAAVYMAPHVAYQVAHFILNNLDEHGLLLPLPTENQGRPITAPEEGA